ncbi:GntR family transcriptional regulator [Thalassobacillus cyri]|uniref:GntR family transcriptional regulator n=1 Tax=Thalassobacillus cyri TaxID=571932 RepID=A0A1H3XU95_9BACI|nr:GntR family transcriptional regulator [Thalassobacillus cyri]
MLNLKRDRSTPLYTQLKNVIEEKIKAGEWEPEQQIPSERELGKEYAVSRITVRQAIDLAVNEGLLYRTHGKGTFVATPTIKQELSKVDSFQSTLSQQGLVASTDIVKAEMAVTDLQLSTLLNVEMMDRLYNLQLVGYGDELPIVFYDSFFPVDVGEQVTEAARKEKEAGRPFTTLDLYKNIPDIAPTHSKQTFESVLADERIAKVLKLDEVTPIFKVTSIIYMGERAIEYRTSYYKGDKYKFFITRSIQ